ncbi:MAG TPA: head GIN domain-containing protein [Flavobacterium sp.]|jgi:hypothetical protein
MRKLFILSVILISQVGFSQIRKKLGDFDEVKVFDRISVELVRSGDPRIEISGKRSEDVEVVNNNGQLKIRMKLEQLLSGEEINVVLYHQELESIDAGEGSFISSAKEIEQPSIEIIAKAGSQIKLELDVKKVKVKAVTGSEITLTGAAENSDITIGTGGIVDAKKLKTSQTSVQISAGGEAHVNASDLVDAKVKAGGNVTIYGDPKHVEEETVLGGSIVRANK